MKRNGWTARVLSAVLLLCLLTGCGSSSSTTEDSTDSTAAEETVQAAEEAEEVETAAEETAESELADTAEETETEDVVETEEAEEAAEEYVFEELVVIDNEECSITITGVDPDNIWGYTLDVALENKNAETNYMFSITDAAVDGVQTDPLFASEVAAGKKDISDINFTDSDLEDNGVAFTDIELSFRVYDSDDWTADDVVNVTVHVYPYGEDAATAFVRSAQDSDIVLVDNEQLTILVTGYDPDSLFGYAVDLYMVNKTDTDITVGVDDASVNGYMADPFWSTTLAAGKCKFSSITWYSSTLEDIGITDGADVEELEFLLTAHKYGDYSSDYYVSQTVTLYP